MNDPSAPPDRSSPPKTFPSCSLEKPMNHPAHAARRQWSRSALLLILLLCSMRSAHAQRVAPVDEFGKTSVPLNVGWRFHEVGKNVWHPATVPGCVHTDLLDNKLIDDPFYRDNEQRLQWIGKTDWEYQTTFNATPALLKHRYLELVFEGLDTYAEVFLNDTPLLDTDNMFRTWRADAKRALHEGTNTLR